ncbi:MAG: hypothetical protein AMDU5_GPLC00002G0023 [Thermoplasmatales archaeon Gpl]|nr:MAG: hypothetical protein AMDU5_GPLC00002G0023 [Thermoplasmatales archaeon Gpl]
MIKKRAYSILAILTIGLLESYIYNLYGYQMLTFFFLSGIFIVSADLWALNHGTFKAMNQLEVRRILEREEMKKGDMVRAELTIRNPSKRNLHFQYFDTLADVFDLKGDYTDSVYLKKGETVKKTYYLSPEAIGKYSIGPLKVICSDALGLGFIEYVADLISTARIGPSSKDTFMQRSERLSNVIFTNGLHISRNAGQGYNFFGIRSYNDSDDMRHVAWNRYNLTGNDELFVKEWEEERQIDAIILIDYSIGSNLGYGKLRMFDFMVTSAINASYTMLKNQDRVGYIIFSSDHQIYIKPSSRSESIENLQKKVAEIRPSGTFNIGAANRYIRKTVKKNAMIFMIISPYSGKNTEEVLPQDLRMEKQEYMYIINPRGFYETHDTEIIGVFGNALIINENKILDTNVKFYRKFGIVARNVIKERILVSLISDYINGRESNRGA